MQSRGNKSALSHPDPFERVAALEALCANADGETAASAAARLLSDGDAGVRESAARKLIELGGEAAALYTAPLVASHAIVVRNLAGDTLTRLGEPAVRALTPLLNHPDKDVRKFVIDVLAMLPSEEVAHLIAHRLDDEDSNVVLAAVDAIGQVGNASFAPALREVYEREPLARPYVLEALGKYGLKEDLSLMEAALMDENPVVQLAAAEALSCQDVPEVLPLLCRKVGQSHPMARPVLLKSIINLCEMQYDLGRQLPPAIKTYLFEMLEDSDKEFPPVAVEGLHWFLDDETFGILMQHVARDEALDTAIFQAVRHYPGASARIIEAADRGNIPANIAATFILGLLAQQVPEDQEWEPLTTFIQAYYGDLDADTKLAALDISIRQRNPGLYRIMRTALTDPDPTVSSFAADAALDVGLITEQDMLELYPRNHS